MSDIINSLDPLYIPFKNLLITLEVAIKAANLPIYRFETLRSFERTQALYSQGRKQLPNGTWIVTDPKSIVSKSVPGKSFHNYAIAADYVFDGDLKKDVIQWDWSDKEPWNKFGTIVRTVKGLRWGGDFHSITDFPHVELDTKIPISELLTIYNKGKLPTVWTALDKEGWK